MAKEETSQNGKEEKLSDSISHVLFIFRQLRIHYIKIYQSYLFIHKMISKMKIQETKRLSTTKNKMIFT